MAVSSGAKALGMLLHEASIIATEERAEIKMIKFFIVRRIVVDGRAFNHKAPLIVKRAGFVDRVAGVRRSSGNQFAF